MIDAVFAEDLGIDPIRRSQLHAAEQRRLLEGRRVYHELQADARRDEDGARKERVRDAAREQVAENADALREKWGAA